MPAAHLATSILALPPAPGDEVRDAVDKAVAFLQADSLDWARIHRCATCHHVPMTVWATREARGRGSRVDEAALAELERFLLDDPEAGKLLPADRSVPNPDEPPGSIGTAYAALGLRAVPESERSEAARSLAPQLQSYLLATQASDGSWTHGGGRAPILESRPVLSLMTLLALDPSDPPARAVIDQWLAANPPTAPGHQEEVLRLLLAARLARTDATGSLSAPIERIAARQREDGGWSQTPERPSDAFATGQALYALLEAGADPDRAEIARARSYLVRTQEDDGSWSIDSRPAEPGGEGAKELRPIIAAASAWATLGLARSLD